MKKKRSHTPDLETIRAAREAIKQERERRKSDEVMYLVTGVPRSENFGDWPATPMPDRYGVYPKTETPTATRTPSKAPAAGVPARMPTEWHYVWVQTRAPTERDPGAIIEGQYATAGDVLYLEDMRGNAIASQRLRSDDNPPAVARKLLRERRLASGPVPGFFDGPSYDPNRVFH